MAEASQCVDERRFINNPCAQTVYIELLCGNQKPLTLFAAGEALPCFKLEEYGHRSLIVLNLVIPANSYLVLPEIAG